MIAAIMCGGRASRMQQGGIEKPLLKVDGIAMVERVILALAGSGRFDHILAAISPNTPKTKELLKSKGIETIETPGEGYSNDLSHLLSKLKPQRVMVVPSDIPLLNSQIISEILDAIDNSSRKEKRPAISIILEKRFVERTGAKPSIVVDQYCHSGITIFNTMSVGTEPVEEYYLVMNRKEIALNVNTKEELELAKKLLV
ncbi:MAG: NTP transferase domain-containing protein [Thermoproteota archaeon]|nr:NTP transferase domain-containing protein [Thermoproteota archaeon]